MGLRRRWILFRWRLADWAWDTRWLPNEVRMCLMPTVYYALKSVHKEMMSDGDLRVTKGEMRRITRRYWRLKLEGVRVDDPRMLARVLEVCKEEEG